MKNKAYIGISFIILVFGILVIPKIVDRFKGDNVVDNDRLNIAPKSELVEIASAPKFSFLNQNKEELTEEFYKDKVYLVEFFFTSCPTICPIMNENMVKIQNEHMYDKNFGIASFSIDAINDTPEVLKQHAKDLGAVHENWNFFAGSQEAIFGLAKNYNMYVDANNDAPGGFEHSGLFALIDKNGKIRSRQDSFGNPIVYYDGTTDEGVNMIKEDIKKLLAE